MSDIIRELEERVSEADLLIEQGTREMASGLVKKQLGEKQKVAYQSALDLELARSGQLPIVEVGSVKTEPAAVNEDTEAPALTLTNDEEEAEDGSKAGIVRELFRQRGSSGIRPRDVRKHFASLSMAVNRNYCYSILQRLKRRTEIEARGSRYYPTPMLGLSKADREEAHENGPLSQPVVN